MGGVIWIINGPSLNLLGTREPELYGRETLEAIMERCKNYAAEAGYSLVAKQSNHEGDLIDWIHEAGSRAQGLIINAAAYSHTSLAIHDALKAVKLPIVEVHLSNLWKREAMRHTSLVSNAVNGIVAGFGGNGYILSLQALFNIISI